MLVSSFVHTFIMVQKYILFLSTNIIWGGSEVLWTAAAKNLAGKGYEVKAGVRYGHPLIASFIPDKQNYIDIQNRIQPLTIKQRILIKLRLGKFHRMDSLQETLKLNKPALAIISQGNNIEGRHLMKDCILLGIPFITITHLVTKDFWPALNDTLINEINLLYKQGLHHYFVSKNTLLLHDKLLGEKLTNSSIVYNPFTKNIPAGIIFPAKNNGIYKVAMIGRIEAFHKGYDLLIEVLKADKWKERPIHFSLFGSGPHVELLQRLIEQESITNFSIHGYQEDISEIWKSCHILLMPSRMEGQSLTLIEAMRFKRAAIVTDVGGTIELVQEGINGFIATHPIPEFIEAAMERAWQKRDEWEQMGIQAAQTIAERHPEDAVAFFNKQLEGILSANL